MPAAAVSTVGQVTVVQPGSKKSSGTMPEHRGEHHVDDVVGDVLAADDRGDADDDHRKGAQRRDDIVKRPAQKAGHQVKDHRQQRQGDHLIQHMLAERAALADGLRHCQPAGSHPCQHKQRPPVVRRQQKVERQAQHTGRHRHKQRHPDEQVVLVIDGGQIGEDFVVIVGLSVVLRLRQPSLTQRTVLAGGRDIDPAFFTEFHRRSSSSLLD